MTAISIYRVDLDHATRVIERHERTLRAATGPINEFGAFLPQRLAPTYDIDDVVLQWPTTYSIPLGQVLQDWLTISILIIHRRCAMNEIQKSKARQEHYAQDHCSYDTLAVRQESQH